MKREQQQANEEARRPAEATGVKPPAPAGESQELREGVRELQDQRARFAEAARLVHQKGIISPTAAEAAVDLERNEQRPGE